MWRIRCFSITNVHEGTFIRTSILHTIFIFLNIGLHIKNQNWGFNVGEIIDINLLNNPLLSSDGVLIKTYLEKSFQIFCFLFYYKT